MTSDNTIADFTEANATTNSLNIKEKTTGQTGDNNTKTFEIMVPLKYLSSFWKTLEMPLINCETNLILTWSEKCVLMHIKQQLFQ